MKQFLLVFLLLFFLVFLEGSITTIPLVLDVLLVLYVLLRSPWIFLAAFLGGLFLDISLVNHPGNTSIFFLVFLLIVNLYERKFEISNVYFILIYSFLGSLIFLKISGYDNIFVQSLLSSIFSVLLFIIMKRFYREKE
ncbi:MAG: hypothetical protein Q8P10_01400 [bacterium]|nr:hypothetical protein [bacterium]